MKRFSFIAILFVGTALAQADGTSRGYTSTQTLAMGGGGGSLDSLLRDPALQKKKTAADSDPAKPKDVTYRAVAKPTRSNSVKDDRKVIVTKDVVDAVDLTVKTDAASSLSASSIVSKPTYSGTQKSGLQRSHTQFSPIPRATQ